MEFPNWPVTEKYWVSYLELRNNYNKVQKPFLPSLPLRFPEASLNNIRTNSMNSVDSIQSWVNSPVTHDSEDGCVENFSEVLLSEGACFDERIEIRADAFSLRCLHWSDPLLTQILFVPLQVCNVRVQTYRVWCPPKWWGLAGHSSSALAATSSSRSRRTRGRPLSSKWGRRQFQGSSEASVCRSLPAQLCPRAREWQPFRPPPLLQSSCRRQWVHTRSGRSRAHNYTIISNSHQTFRVKEWSPTLGGST